MNIAVNNNSLSKDQSNNALSFVESAVKKLDQLPKEILLKIFDVISTDNSQEFWKEKCFETCKQFYELRPLFLLKHPQLLGYAVASYFHPEAGYEKKGQLMRFIQAIRTYGFRALLYPPKSPLVSITAKIAHRVVRLCINNMELSVEAAKMLGKTFKNIQYLDCQMMQLSPKAIDQLAQLSQLQELHFSHTGPNFLDDTKPNLEKIIHGSISSYCYLQSKYNIRPLTQLAHLQYLTFSDIYIASEEISHLFKITTLSRLQLIRCQTDINGKCSNIFFQSLRHISLINCNRLTNSDISWILKQPKLESFTFVSMHLVETSRLAINLSEIVNKSGFHKLFIYDNTNTTIGSKPPNIFTQIEDIALLTNLKKLTCYGNEVLDINFSKLTNLEVLHLTNTIIDSAFCTSQQLKNFATLATLPKLHTLIFDYCYSGAPNFFSALSQCAHLQNLYLQGIRQINCNELNFQDLNTIKTLRKLECSNTGGMNDKILMSLLELPLLEEFNIIHCNRVTMEARKVFNNKAPHVKLIY